MRIKSKVDFELMLKFTPLLGVLICGMLWTTAISKTWDSYKTYATLMQAGQSEQLSISPAFTESRASAINKLYDRYEVDTLKWKSKLWNHCATLGSKHNVSMRSFSPWERFTSNKDSLLIQKIEMSGTYHNLISLQQELEVLSGIGKVSGLVYRKPIRESNTTLTILVTGIPQQKLE